MKTIFKQYGAAIITVIAAVLFFVILLIYFDTNNGELKKTREHYSEIICMQECADVGGVS